MIVLIATCLLGLDFDLIGLDSRVTALEQRVNALEAKCEDGSTSIQPIGIPSWLLHNAEHDVETGILYTGENCAPCQAIKTFMKESFIPFEERQAGGVIPRFVCQGEEAVGVKDIKTLLLKVGYQFADRPFVYPPQPKKSSSCRCEVCDCPDCRCSATPCVTQQPATVVYSDPVYTSDDCSDGSCGPSMTSRSSGTARRGLFRGLFKRGGCRSCR